MALYYLKASGEFDAAVREWENKAAADKTWANTKRSSQRSMYMKTNKQTHSKAIQSQCNGRISGGNGNTDRNLDQTTHSPDGGTHQEHN
jgi:hypothetical protein